MDRCGRLVSLLCVVALALTQAAVVRAGLFRVPGDYDHIQDAMDAAAHGDTVLVGPGTYTGPLNRNLDFGTKDLAVISELGQNHTTLDCQSQGRGFYLHSGQTTDALIQGFTVLNGLDPSQGGGMLCYGASPTVQNCTFLRCYSDDGGAIFCDAGSSPEFTGCTFSDNSAAFGAGLFCENSSPSVHDCDFLENHSVACGGGVFCHSGSYPDFDGCTFSGNSSDDGGGMFVYDGLPTITRCEFVDNVAAFGGGFFCELPSPTLEWCTFWGNHASGRGGGMFFHQGTSATIVNCTLCENGASEGGGVFYYASTPMIEHTIISFGTSGGAVGCDGGGGATMICSDVYGNVGGDWMGCIAGQCGVEGNICEDPLFCGAGAGNFELHVDSPCAPEQSACGLIGAWGVGCGGVAVEERSWGSIKAMFR